MDSQWEMLGIVPHNLVFELLGIALEVKSQAPAFNIAEAILYCFVHVGDCGFVVHIEEFDQIASFGNGIGTACRLDHERVA